MNLLNPGDLFDNLPETYVIFITKNDVLGYNLPINHIRRRSNETGEIFESSAAAARQVGIASRGKIGDAIKNPNKTCGGYHWTLAE